MKSAETSAERMGFCGYYNVRIDEELLKKCIEAHIPGKGCERCRYLTDRAKETV